MAAGRSFRADWVDSMLLEAAGISWKGEALHGSLLSPKYRSKVPESKARFVRQHTVMEPLRVPQ